ncbi:MAG: hypothetical protein ABI439_07500 [Rhodospirillales bacterium]
MIDLLPLPREEFRCVCSDTKLTGEAFILPGMIPLLRSHCAKCSKRFLCQLRHGWHFGGRLMFDQAERSVISADNIDWYEEEFRRAMASRGRPAPALEKISRRPLGRDVTIVVALDPTYGHLLQRLFSIDAIDPATRATGMVVIVPRFAAWLVPDDAAEIWLVDAPLRELNLWNDAVADAVAALARNVDRLRLAPMRLGGYSVDVERYTRVKPFEANDIGQVIPPRLTISWREDRCWTYRGQRKPDQEAVVEQFTMICTMLDILRDKIADLDVAVIGYGKKGGFAPWVQDLRIVEHDTARERDWAHRCSQSHLVFGIQGSNMILPSAHAGGSLELMPTGHWKHNMVTWEWTNRLSAQAAMERYLHIPLSSSFSDVISIALVQLCRMQVHALWAAQSKAQDETAARQLALAALRVKGGQPIEYRDVAGQLL